LHPEKYEDETSRKYMEIEIKIDLKTEMQKDKKTERQI
jgi:hypothetical protein